MHILHLTHQYLPDSVGGVEIYTQVLARRQVERGHEVAVFYRRCAPASAPEHAALSERDDHGVRVWAASDGSAGPARRVLATFGSRPLQRGWEHVLDSFRPDLVHVQHLMGLPASLLAALRRRRIPHVVTLHDYWWVCANAQLLTNDAQKICGGPQAFINCARCALARLGRPGFRPAIPLLTATLAARNAALRRALSGAQGYIAPTHFVAAWYARHGVPARRITVIPHGIDIPAGLSAEPRPRHVPLRLAYIGGLTWQKGIHIALQAANRCAGAVELWIAGDESVDPDYVRRLKDTASPRVRFLGKLSHSQVWETLAQIDALLVPSLWYETFSLVVHEAHAAGVPVVASHLGVLAEVVRDGVDGLLALPGDVEAWCAALRRLLDEPGLLPRLQRGLKRPLSVSEHLDRIESFYRRVLEQAPRL